MVGLNSGKLLTVKFDAPRKIINRRGKIEGLKISICGDILHSRVARSNIYLMNMLGAEVNVVAPKNLLPHSIERLGVKVFNDMKKGLDGCDIVMMLRLQNERMQGYLFLLQENIMNTLV